MRDLFILFFFVPVFILNAQSQDIFSRLQAIENNGIIFYNIDGYTITNQTFNYKFNEKNLKKVFRKYSIKTKDKKVYDEQLKYNHLYVIKDETIADNLIQNNSYYFIEDTNHQISVVQFNVINKRDRNFERNLVKAIIDNKIPKENFSSMVIDSINFAGRKIALGNSCYWMHVNNVQCPYYGQMNWSIHKYLEDAKSSVENQLKVTKSQKGGKVISEEIVPIEFEGADTNAKRVVYDFTGVKSILAGMSGGKTLTIYYIATKVRDNYVSCVMSFWNNDVLTENGLTPLLEKFIKLKETR